MNKKPKIICLTPVKNEGWILDNFLKCASLWADHIIIADQNSTDNSRSIAKKYPKVILVKNPNKKFGENTRQKVLIEEARKIPGDKLLIALDADEILTANYSISPEWNKIINCKPGTVIKFNFANITPDFQKYWLPEYEMPWGFYDDGSKHSGKIIHSYRLPIPENANFIVLNDIKVMHFQFVDWDRMESKHRWYQCWERLNKPEQSSIRIYRNYHHMDAIKKDELKKIPEDWLEYYQKLGIDLKSFKKEKEYYWDNIVLGYIKEYGAKYFSREYIWDQDWVEKAGKKGFKNLHEFRDPRTVVQKAIHFYLKKTQYYNQSILVRAIDKVLVDIFKR